MSDTPVKVIVTFLEDVEQVEPTEKRLTLADFSFRESQKVLAHYKGSFSESVVEERR